MILLLLTKALLVFAMAIPNVQLSKIHHETGIASIFGFHGDKLGRQAFACSRGERPQDSDGRFCAHREFKCGTVVVIENIRTGSRSHCIVRDHGPYGAYKYIDGIRHWVIKIKKSDPGQWRGVIDMSQDVADEIGHNGFERVRVWKLNNILKYRKKPLVS